MKKTQIFTQLQTELEAKGFQFESTDFERPWGGFFVLKENQSEKFIKTFYPEERVENLTKGAKISPKILVVAPGKRLSWQYHNRRSEVWKLIAGTAGVVRSATDEQGDVYHLEQNEKVVLAQGERHRLVGLKEFGIVAEIWQHTDRENLSDEEDIVRLEDDFGR
ncbi:MAG: mannose-6-phosphate isomerase [Saprospiraceae bacterium]|jgi:mannose-6-phosphate isomerase